MPYWQLFYHVVWATKNRLPLVTLEIEPQVYGLVRDKTSSLGGTVFAVNGMPDHVHLVAAIPPRISVAQFIGQVKGVSSAKFNQSGQRGTPLYWQEEYGVFSFDAKRLPNFVSYVERQKEHHNYATVIPVLERMDNWAVTIVREPSAEFAYEEDAWRREFQNA